jgi:histidyl-tRNA synthetase
MKIVRGLDYYTGTVFEFCLPEYNGIGSVGGGGRYENLAGHFTDQAFPGVGGSIGLTRLFFVLSEYGLVKDSDKKPLDICIIPVSENEINYSMALAARLRGHNTKVDVILTDKKLGDKMTYAAKVANKGIVVGESEVASGNLKIKDFSTGEVSNL